MLSKPSSFYTTKTGSVYGTSSETGYVYGTSSETGSVYGTSSETGSVYGTRSETNSMHLYKRKTDSTLIKNCRKLISFTLHNFNSNNGNYINPVFFIENIFVMGYYELMHFIEKCSLLPEPRDG